MSDQQLEYIHKRMLSAEAKVQGWLRAILGLGPRVYMASGEGLGRASAAFDLSG